MKNTRVEICRYIVHIALKVSYLLVPLDGLGGNLGGLENILKFLNNRGELGFELFLRSGHGGI